MQDKPVALITGANQGIGLQIAKDLSAHGFTVLVGSRNFEKGETAAKSIGADAHAVQLDVTDHASITAATERIRKEFGRLDVLVNNAAISNASRLPDQSVEDYASLTRPSNVPLDEMRAVWETNVFGVIAVYQAMLPLLRESPNARIVNVSSGVGSLTMNSDPAFAYRSIFGPGMLRPRRRSTLLHSPWQSSWRQPGSRLTPSHRALSRPTSTHMQARELSRRVPASRCASHCSARMVRQVRLHAGKTKRSRGDVVWRA